MDLPTLRGERVTLRQVTDDDIEPLVAFIEDERVNRSRPLARRPADGPARG